LVDKPRSVLFQDGDHFRMEVGGCEGPRRLREYVVLHHNRVVEIVADPRDANPDIEGDEFLKKLRQGFKDAVARVKGEMEAEKKEDD
jgi:hypothetical protein